MQKVNTVNYISFLISSFIFKLSQIVCVFVFQIIHWEDVNISISEVNKLATMSSQIAMAQFVSGLKSRNEDTRIKNANDLYHFVSTELREMPLDEHTQFMDQFNHHIFEMVSSSDLSDRKGGILAIGMCFFPKNLVKNGLNN